MKTKQILLIAVVAFAAMMQSCKKDAETVAAEPVTSSTDLISLLTTTPPSPDANIDASWANCNKLVSNTVEVPDTTLFPKLYQLFMGKKQDFTIRSQYDSKNIYFLVEVTDDTQSTDNRAWYFDGTNWTQPASVNNFTATDAQFGQDGMGLIFPVNANAAWDKSTCLSTCHYAVNPKYTNHYTYKLGDASDVMKDFMADCWFWRSVGSAQTNQLSDGYIASDTVVVAGKKTKIGRASSDDAGKITYGYTANKDTMSVAGKKIAKPTASQVFPSYVLVSATGVPSIRVSDISGGAAIKVDSISSLGNGKLYLHNNTVIDPKASSDYGLKGTKKIPAGVVRGPILGSAGDVATYATYANGKWIIKVIRPLTTTDLAQDVQFDITKPLMFGFATFNNANNQHLIKTNLKLSFATVATK